MLQPWRTCRTGVTWRTGMFIIAYSTIRIFEYILHEAHVYTRIRIFAYSNFPILIFEFFESESNIRIIEYLYDFKITTSHLTSLLLSSNKFQGSPNLHCHLEARYSRAGAFLMHVGWAGLAEEGSEGERGRYPDIYLITRCRLPL